VFDKYWSCYWHFVLIPKKAANGFVAMDEFESACRRLAAD
jgi:hypothetical protein